MNDINNIHNNLLVTKNKIKNAAAVAGVAALLSIINTLTGIAVYFLHPEIITNALGKEGFNAGQAGLLNNTTGVSLFLSFIVNIILFYFLYKFSVMAKKGVEQNDRLKLESGLYSLAGYFKSVSILFILFIGIIILVVMMTGMSSLK